jgi:AraC-like DNA-binding protein
MARGSAPAAERSSPSTPSPGPSSKSAPSAGRAKSSHNRLSADAEAEIVRLYIDERLTRQQVSDLTGHARATISMVVIRNGHKMRPRSQHGVVRSSLVMKPELEAQIVAIYTSGGTLADIARALPVSKNTARRALVRNGVAIRARGYQRKYRRIPTHEIRTVESALRRGLTAAQVATETGMSVGQVYERAKYVGLAAPTRPRMTDEKLREAWRMRDAGLTLKAIGQHFGVTESSVWRWFHKMPKPQARQVCGPELAAAPLLRTLHQLIDFETKLAMNGVGPQPNEGARRIVCARAGLWERNLFAWEHGERKAIRAELADQVMQRLDLLWWEVWREGDEGYEQARKAFGDG